jgi:hypothetical protein
VRLSRRDSEVYRQATDCPLATCRAVRGHSLRRAELRYSLAGVVRGSRCGLRSGPSLGRFRPGGAGVRRFVSRFRRDAGLSFDRSAMTVEPSAAGTPLSTAGQLRAVPRHESSYWSSPPRGAQSDVTAARSPMGERPLANRRIIDL